MSRRYMTNGVMRGKIRWFHHGLNGPYWAKGFLGAVVRSARAWPNLNGELTVGRKGVSSIFLPKLNKANYGEWPLIGMECRWDAL